VASDALVDVIAADLATWAPHPTHVELAIYGSGDPAEIAAALSELARSALGSPIAGARFYGSSIGSVASVVLADGREVVIKVHQPTTTVAQLAELVRLRSHLEAVGSPRVLAGPLPLAKGHAVIEQFADGTWRDPHEPAVRREFARGLHAIVTACRPLVATSTLAPMMFASSDQLWPTPHSKLFDFAATARGAEWIDEVARAAREVAPAGELAIGHTDWRAEHARFTGDRITVAYDWDSLARDREPALIGIVAHAFPADWTREGRAQAPTLDEARGFVADYEAARNCPFAPDERRYLAATFALTCAYTARCGHALGNDQREIAGTFQHLVARHGLALLAL
jgi:hypothetical protein